MDSADPSGQWVRYSDYAALEAKLAARTGGMKPLDEDDYEEIISAAAINMRKTASGARGQIITVQDGFDWWVMKETEHRILSALSTAGVTEEELKAADRAYAVAFNEQMNHLTGTMPPADAIASASLEGLRAALSSLGIKVGG